MNEKPNYYAIIPGEVRYDPELKDKAKLLYGEITALSNKEGYCFASNTYFAELYGVSTRTIIRMINSLVNKGYLNRITVYKKGTKEVIQRKLYLVKNMSLPTDKVVTRGSEEIVTDNNTSINNTRINKKEIYKEKYGTYKRITLTNEEYTRLVEEFGEEFINKQIELLDEYVESNNNKNKYTNFNLVLRKSIRENWFNKTKKGEGSFLETMQEIYDEQRNNN